MEWKVQMKEKLLWPIKNITRKEFEQMYPNVNITESYVYPCAHQWINVEDKLPENRKDANISKWIKTKDRLPENNQIVLVLNEEGEMAVCKVEITEWNYFFVLYNTSHQITFVTHWMPLPEPPNEI